ncbi:MAG: NADH-quinone oxidoreductase subunit C [Burkholderiales bacterium]
MSTLETLRSALSQGDRVARIEFGLVVVDVAPADVAAVAARIRNPLGFDVLLDVTAIDWPQRTPRFDVVWHFYSTLAKVRVRMKTAVPAEAPVVASLTPLYGSAAFMERETHDMYGIVFAGNDDLRPILLYEGFVGHPLRKDYAKDHEQPLVPYREP